MYGINDLPLADCKVQDGYKDQGGFLINLCGEDQNEDRKKEYRGK